MGGLLGQKNVESESDPGDSQPIYNFFGIGIK